MLYFDLRPSLKLLSVEERGRLLDAILDYAESGIKPELEGMAAMAWEFIKPRIDRDSERYEEICRKRSAAVSSRWKKEAGEQEYPSDTNECKSIQRVPTTNTTSNTTSTL